MRKTRANHRILNNDRARLSDFSGEIARYFHADADFGDYRSCPSHVSLCLHLKVALFPAQTFPCLEQRSTLPCTLSSIGGLPNATVF